MPQEPLVTKKHDYSTGIQMGKTATKFRNHKRMPSDIQSPFKKEQRNSLIVGIKITEYMDQRRSIVLP
jgi:hypothetical protein